MLGTEETMDFEETPFPRHAPVSTRVYDVPPIYWGQRIPQPRPTSTREIGIQTNIPMHSHGTQTESAHPKEELSVKPKVRQSQPRRQHDRRMQSSGTSDSDKAQSSRREADESVKPKVRHSQPIRQHEEKKRTSSRTSDSNEAQSSRREAERERQVAQRRNRREGQLSIRRKVTYAEPEEGGNRKRQSRGEQDARTKEQRLDEYEVVSTETFAVSSPPTGTTHSREASREFLPGGGCPFVCSVIPVPNASVQKHFFT